MMFCPKCSALLKIKNEKGKKVVFCSCGYTSKKIEKEVSFKEKLKKEQDVEVVEEGKDSPRSIVDSVCPKCEHNKAEFWMMQTRAGDEPETRFFKCKKCGHTWREY